MLSLTPSQNKYLYIQIIIVNKIPVNQPGPQQSPGLYFPPSFAGANVNIQGINSGKKNCNCKNSRCLKLYCECFASGEYCKNCNCNGCCNNIENEAIRKETIAAILERNPNAFRPKISSLATPQGVTSFAGNKVLQSPAAGLKSAIDASTSK